MVFQQWKDEIRSCGVDRVSHQGIKFCRDHEIITANLVDSSIKLVREEPSLPHPECREIRFEGEHAGFANVFKLELYQVFTRSVHAPRTNWGKSYFSQGRRIVSWSSKVNLLYRGDPRETLTAPQQKSLLQSCRAAFEDKMNQLHYAGAISSTLLSDEAAFSFITDKSDDLIWWISQHFRSGGISLTIDPLENDPTVGRDVVSRSAGSV